MTFHMKTTEPEPAAVQSPTACPFCRSPKKKRAGSRSICMEMRFMVCANNRTSVIIWVNS